MTSVDVPYSIAAALPSLAVLDITNEVAHEIAEAELAYARCMTTLTGAFGDAFTSARREPGGDLAETAVFEGASAGRTTPSTL